MSTDEHGFGHSMADLMAGLAVTFLIVAVIFILRATDAQRKVEAAARDARAERTAMQAKLDKATKNDQWARDNLVDLVTEIRKRLPEQPGLRVVFNPDEDPYLATFILNPEQFNFSPESCELTEAMRSVIQGDLAGTVRTICEKVAKTATPAQRTGFVQSITLEGHTDKRPFPGTQRKCGADPALDPFANNVRLSAARAQSVFFALRHAIGVDVARSCLEPSFVVSGRGPAEATDNDAASRKVVIRVRAKSGLSSEAVPPQ